MCRCPGHLICLIISVSLVTLIPLTIGMVRVGNQIKIIPKPGTCTVMNTSVIEYTYFYSSEVYVTYDNPLVGTNGVIFTLYVMDSKNLSDVLTALKGYSIGSNFTCYYACCYGGAAYLSLTTYTVKYLDDIAIFMALLFGCGVGVLILILVLTETISCCYTEYLQKTKRNEQELQTMRNLKILAEVTPTFDTNLSTVHSAPILEEVKTIK